MWEDKVTKRTARADWTWVEPSVACGLTCPEEGHRARLDHPGHYYADVEAERRVRALHATWSIRTLAFGLLGRDSLAYLLEQLVCFDVYVDPEYADSGTLLQLGYIRVHLARFVARRLSAIKHAREEKAYVAGLAIYAHHTIGL